MTKHIDAIIDGHEMKVPAHLMPEEISSEEGRDTLPNLIIGCVCLIGLYLFLTGALT